MGNYKFRLSDMIPNAWFYKLKDMNRVKNQIKTKQSPKEKKHTPSSSSSSISSSPNNPHMLDQRKSYHFTRDFNDFHPNSPKITAMKKFTTDQPRKSTRKRRTRNRVLNRVPDPSSPSDSDRALTPDTLDFMLCKCRVQNDIVIELVDDNNNTEFNRLPPIITKKNPIEVQRKGYGSSKRVSANSTSPGVKLRTNTPRIGNRRINGGGGGGGRKSLSSNSNSNSSSGSTRRSGSTESFAVVKTSKDPWRDFRESMVEMIVENNISASKDLEELLASYLSLNSDEYHDLIINVFKQIWFDFVHVLPK